MLRAGDSITLDLYQLHWNHKQWIEPEKFIPERFDPTSRYFLKPNGKKRHPMAYGPFLGGKRICLGKTFVDIVSKLIGPVIIGHFNYKFVDPKNYIEKPPNNLAVISVPKVLVTISENKI